jgi:hypothetical protein
MYWTGVCIALRRSDRDTSLRGAAAGTTTFLWEKRSNDDQHRTEATAEAVTDMITKL